MALRSTNRRCSHCRRKVPADSAYIGGLRAFCSYEHLNEFMQSAKGREVVQKQQRSQLKEVRDRHKTLGWYMKQAQAAFNRYIRLRDAGRYGSCISCGNKPETVYGGGADSGHYLSRGSRKGHFHRFNLKNAHLQCVRCNRYRGGAVADFRDGLIKRYGIEYVEALESDDRQLTYTKEYLTRIEKIFKRRAKLYERLRGLD